MQRKQQLHEPITFVLYNLFLFWLLIGSHAFVTNSLRHARHDRLLSQSSIFSLSATVEDETDTIANKSRKIKRHGGIIGFGAPILAASDGNTIVSASVNENNKDDVDGGESCDNNNEPCDEDEDEDRQGGEDQSQEEGKSRRANAAMLQQLKNSSSSSTRSRKNVSESKQRRGQRETSVGERRTGAASRARAGSGGLGKLIGNIRTSAAAAAAIQKKKEGSGSTNIDDNKRDDDESRASTGYFIDKGVISQLSTPMVLPAEPKRRASIIPQQLPLFRSSVVPKEHIKYYMSVDIAQQSDDADIADLRLSVFGNNNVDSKMKWIEKTCEVLKQRRKMGTTCLTACVNFVDANRWMLGSLECSTHEVSDCLFLLRFPFLLFPYFTLNTSLYTLNSFITSNMQFVGTELGLRRPASSIMYITEVAVSAKLRRSGIGKMLMKV